jgi:hypothetical protein
MNDTENVEEDAKVDHSGKESKWPPGHLIPKVCATMNDLDQEEV